MADFPSEYHALKHGAGLVDLPGRTILELTGADRAAFLHNMCTNDVRALRAGRGCEAFVTNVQGKVLGFVYVFAGADSIVVETVPGQADRLLPHLDRYIIREDVQLHDRTSAWRELLLSGTQSAGILQAVLPADCPLPTELLGHAAAQIEDAPVVVRRVDWTAAEAFLIHTGQEHLAAVTDRLVAAGAVPCGGEAFHAARIEAGTPLYGQDINETSLPQEVARDDRAISFNKGCYLGQETVARIDALGHVNKTLCLLRFDGQQVPEPGLEIKGLEKLLAHITSATFSPALGAPLALAYVRRGHNAVGTRLDTPLGKAEVVGSRQ